MKKLSIALLFVISSTMAAADDFSARMLENSTVQTVANIVANSVLASTQGTTIATSEQQRSHARKIQNDVQDFAQNGTISIFLAEKINMVSAINPELSLQDSLDALILASDLILSK